MHHSIFILVFNQCDAQNLFHNKFYLHYMASGIITPIGVMIPEAM